jgi:hypothetical protein
MYCIANLIDGLDLSGGVGVELQLGRTQGDLPSGFYPTSRMIVTGPSFTSSTAKARNSGSQIQSCSGIQGYFRGLVELTPELLSRSAAA